MRYHTNITGKKYHDEYYECRTCGKQYESYSHLNHPSDETGGYCWCGSEDIKIMTKVTVYQELWVEQDEKMVDIIDTAIDIEDWQLNRSTIRLDKPPQEITVTEK